MEQLTDSRKATNWCVYMHENRENGKKYIGITCQKPTTRWKNGHGYVHSARFFSAIKHYGWDAFRHEILFTELTQEEAERLEVQLIEKYQTQNPEKGYNLEAGGQVTKRTAETRRRISEALIGKEQSPEHRRKNSERHKGELNNRYGVPHTDETRQKISASMKGRAFSEEHRRRLSEAAKKRAQRKAAGNE